MNLCQEVKNVIVAAPFLTLAFLSQLFLFIYFQSRLLNSSVVNYSDDDESSPKFNSVTPTIDNRYTRNRYFYQRGNFTVFTNYVQASNDVREMETVTLVTQATLDYLENITTLVQFWSGPISLVVYAPGPEFDLTMHKISLIHTCSPGKVAEAVKSNVSFHIFYETQYLPDLENGSNFYDLLLLEVNCSQPSPPRSYVEARVKFRETHKDLLYPINVARNIGREMAQTHFVLVSDIELMPNPPDLIPKFLDLVSRRKAEGKQLQREVFVLPPFEVSKKVKLKDIPRSKFVLRKFLFQKRALAVPFHYYACFRCHLIPQYANWTRSKGQDSRSLNIFHTSLYVTTAAWEPFYIGTRYDPPFDEDFYRETALNKAIQSAILCHQSYTFHILDNAFLIHFPGFKYGKTFKNSWLKIKGIQYAQKSALPLQYKLYGRILNRCWQTNSSVPKD